MRAERDSVCIGGPPTHEHGIGAIVARWSPLASLERKCALRTTFSARCFGTHRILLERKESLGR